MKHILTILLLLPLLSFAQYPIIDISKGVKLAWDAPVHSYPIANYRLHLGSIPNTYTESRLLTSATNATVQLDVPGIYYLAVTAVDALGLESTYSNEIVVDVRLINPPPSPVLRLSESFQVLSIVETTSTTTYIKEVTQ